MWTGWNIGCDMWTGLNIGCLYVDWTERRVVVFGLG